MFRRKQPTAFEQALRELARGNYREALERLDACLAEPDCTAAARAAAVNKRGVALIGLGRSDEARAAFESALGIVPRYAPAMVNIGNLHLEAGEIEIAISHYQGAIRSDDRYGPAHHNLAVAYKRLGRMADSIRELRRAHKLS